MILALPCSGRAAFNAWLGDFVTCANANLADLGLVAGDLTPVTTAKNATQQKNAGRTGAFAW